MTYTRHILTLCLLLLFAPAALSAQSAEERLEAAKSRAASNQVPLSLLEAKIKEGKAKGVSLDRIASVVEHRTTVLIRARSLVGKGQAPMTDAELSVSADALQRGVSEEVLSTLASEAPEGRRSAAIHALTALVAQGQVPEKALAAVREALKKGPEALANLPAQAQAGQAKAAGARRGPPAGVGRPGVAGPPSRPGTPPAGRPGSKPGGGKPGGLPGGRPGGH